MNVHYTSRFKKDFKRITRQNKEPQKLRDVIEKLLSGKSLEAKYRDHPLSGNWKGHRDCHLEPDWIMIYRISDQDLFLERDWFSCRAV